MEADKFAVQDHIMQISLDKKRLNAHQWELELAMTSR
jgi:hypothetical protein